MREPSNAAYFCILPIPWRNTEHSLTLSFTIVGVATDDLFFIGIFLLLSSLFSILCFDFGKKTGNICRSRKLGIISFPIPCGIVYLIRWLHQIRCVKMARVDLLETFNEESETATKEERIKKGGTFGKARNQGSGMLVRIGVLLSRKFQLLSPWRRRKPQMI